MSEPPESAARGLADILREAGISSAGTGGRRRRRDDTETATETPTETGAAPETQTDLGGLSSYLLAVSDPAPPDKAPEKASVEMPVEMPVEVPVEVPPPRTDTGPVPMQGWAPPGTGWPDSAASLPAASTAPAVGASRPAPVTSTQARTTEARPVAASPITASPITASPITASPAAASPAAASRAAASPAAASPITASPAEAAGTAPAHANRSPSPLATGPADDPDEIDSGTAKPSGALSWLILVVELLAAAGLGIAAWYAFSALWDLLPYVAAFVGPLVVTGLVAVAGALRARTGRNPLGLPTLCILVFAGTVLVVLPAATLIVP